MSRDAKSNCANAAMLGLLAITVFCTAGAAMPADAVAVAKEAAGMEVNQLLALATVLAVTGLCAVSGYAFRLLVGTLKENTAALQALRDNCAAARGKG